MHVWIAGILSIVFSCLLIAYAGIYRIHIQSMHMICKKHNNNRIAYNMVAYAWAAYKKERISLDELIDDSTFCFTRLDKVDGSEKVFVVRIQTVDKKICDITVYCNDDCMLCCRKNI